MKRTRDGEGFRGKGQEVERTGIGEDMKWNDLRW